METKPVVSKPLEAKPQVTRPPLYGLMAEFDNPTDVVEAARHTYEEGYRMINGYSPYPIEELSEAIGFHRTRLPVIVFIGGLVGGLVGYLMQYYLSAVDYPLIVGGRPYHSWPSFIPITFEMTVLCAALSAGFWVVGPQKIPPPPHPHF